MLSAVSEWPIASSRPALDHRAEYEPVGEQLRVTVKMSANACRRLTPSLDDARGRKRSAASALRGQER
jgi:hypothetical protein